MSHPNDPSLRMESRDNCLLIHVLGELDHHYCESARGRIDDSYDDCRALHLRVCTRSLPCPDSTGSYRKRRIIPQPYALRKENDYGTLLSSRI